MKSYYLLLLLLLYINFSFSETRNTGLFQDITVVTEHAPPFQYSSKMQVDSGFSVDLFNEICNELHLSLLVKSYPWVRAYEMAQHRKNVLIFSITRNEEREEKFQWAGQICVLEDFLWTLDNGNIPPLKDLTDVAGYKVGVPHDDNQHQFLKDKGLEDGKELYIVPNWDQAIKMFYSGRVDFVMGSELMLMERIKVLKLDPSAIKKSLSLGKMGQGLYFAFSKETPEAVVNEFTQALQKIKQDGRYDAIWDKWVGSEKKK